jgi:hypothetical protein
MPEFNKQLFFDPKIDIVGKEVPLAALEKTGNVLQGRYDQAMDNETKIGAVAKKLAASSNPVDRETANQILKTYQDKLATRAKNGKYFDMVWQTQQDAMDVAGMYEGLSNRNKEIEKAKQNIISSPKYFKPGSREAALKQFENTLKSSQYNTENNILQGLEVNPFNEASDVDALKWAVDYGHLMKPTVNKVSGTSIVGVDANGNEIKDPKIKPTMLMTKTRSGNLVKLTSQEIQNALAPAAMSDPNINAELERDVYRAGLDINTPEGQAYKKQLFENQILPAIGAASGILRQNQDMSSDNIGFHNMPKEAESSRRGSGRFRPYDETGVIPVNSLASDYVASAGETELRKSLNKSLTGDTKELNKITNFINENISNAKIAKDSNLEKKYTSFKNTINEIKTLNQDDKNKIEKAFSNMLNGTTKSQIQNQFGKSTGKVEKIIDSLLDYTNTNFFDTDSEDAFTEFVKSNKAIKQSNIIQPNLQADGAIENLNQFNGMLSKSYFDDYDSNNPMKKDTKYTLAGMTETPLGNGIGHILQLKDADGNAVYVTPKDDRILENLDNVFPQASRTNEFKGLSDFYENETKTIPEILKEMKVALPKEMAENDFALRYKKGEYELLNPNGQVVTKSNNLISLLDNFLPLN